MFSFSEAFSKGKGKGKGVQVWPFELSVSNAPRITLFTHSFSTFIIRKEIEMKFCKGRCYFQIFFYV